jgi:hypothetical protein
MRSLTIIFCAVLVMFYLKQTQARIIYVPSEQPTIQAGINASVNGDTVLVSPGIYHECINFNGHNTVLGSLFLTTDDTTYITNTIIDGDSTGSVVTFNNGESLSARLVGFTLRHGWGTGGGIYCNGSNPTISNNVIESNSCPDFGGGIYCFGSSPTISNNLIERNSAWYAGGICCHFSSSPVLVNNTIRNNSAGYRGGGIDCYYYSCPTLDHNIIVGNTAGAQGGGIFAFHYTNITITNSTISGNSAADYGGGMFLARCTITVTNTILWADFAAHGREMWHEQGGYPDNVTYSDVQGGSEGEGNIDADPLFCNPENGNYYLWVTSPCLGTGQGGANIGVFGVGCSTFGDANGDGIINSADIVYLINYLFISGPSPQPWQAGDANCDGAVNSADVAYLINYLFVGGPPPGC